MLNKLIQYQSYALYQFKGQNLKSQMLQAMMNNDDTWFTQQAIQLEYEHERERWMELEESIDSVIPNFYKEKNIPVMQNQKFQTEIHHLNLLYILRYIHSLQIYTDSCNIPSHPLQPQEIQLIQHLKNIFSCPLSNLAQMLPHSTFLPKIFSSIEHHFSMLNDDIVKCFRSDRICQFEKGINCKAIILDAMKPNPCKEPYDRKKWEQECRQACKILPDYEFLFKLSALS